MFDDFRMAPNILLDHLFQNLPADWFAGRFSRPGDEGQVLVGSGECEEEGKEKAIGARVHSASVSDEGEGALYDERMCGIIQESSS
ncbi:hypothetical protein NSND_62904 [Nitrospira sp. ND1]|nr:hypothetical protein NSND_62904 [Nitrospira sp. ND1]